jgi:predicted nucleic acid-binding protein
VTLVDTSIWVEHLRRGHPGLSALLQEAAVATHPFVIGEIACGNLRRRAEVLGLLAALPALEVVRHGEVLAFVESRRLSGRGLGWLDMHLLASARVSHVPLWTLDRRLAGTARLLGIAASR